MVNTRRFLSLDLVRGLAALSVLFTHWVQITPTETPLSLVDVSIGVLDSLMRRLIWSDGGLHPGVIIFIVLSGFCIHLPLSGRRPNLWTWAFWRTFARRRFIRVAPLYWVAVILGLLATIAVHGAEPSVGWGTALFLRLSFLTEFGSPSDLALGNFPLYTVVTEMWLYAAYPLLLAIRLRYGWPLLFALGVLLHVASFLVLPRFVNDGDFATTGIWAFWLYWMIGAYAAERFAQVRARGALRFPTWRPWLAAAVYVAANVAWPFGPETRIVGKSLILALATGVVLHDVLISEARMTAPTGAQRALAWLGERSYTLYATHAPVLALVVAAVTAFSLSGALFGRLVPFIAVSLMTLVAFNLVERPAHALARASGRRALEPNETLLPEPAVLGRHR